MVLKVASRRKFKLEPGTRLKTLPVLPNACAVPAAGAPINCPETEPPMASILNCAVRGRAYAVTIGVGLGACVVSYSVEMIDEIVIGDAVTVIVLVGSSVCMTTLCIWRESVSRGFRLSWSHVNVRAPYPYGHGCRYAQYCCGCSCGTISRILTATLQSG